MNRIFDRKIILEDGTEFYGYGFGAKRDALVELVFNTSMVGYQEILSDPSYTAQAVVMTYPLIGNYGMCDDDYETDRPTISGLVVREFNSEPSNFRAARTLEDVMIQYDIVGIAGVDTPPPCPPHPGRGYLQGADRGRPDPKHRLPCGNALHQFANKSGFLGEYEIAVGFRL